MRLLATAVLLLLAASLSACSQGSSDPDADPVATHTAHDGSVYTSVDLEFATNAIPLLADAMVLVDEALERNVSPRTEDLAHAVRDGRGPEIEQLVSFLGDWGEPVPETARDHANAGHGHPRNEPGSAAVEPGFEEEWAAEMTSLLEEVDALAERQVADGSDEEATALAEQMRTNLSTILEDLEDLEGA